MTVSSERSISQEINIWIQIIGIIIGSVWAVYVFIYKEIILPKASPVNITLDLQLKKIENPNSQHLRDKNQGLTAIEMEITATNPSSRMVYLVPSKWFTYGYNVKIHDEDPELFDKVPAMLNSQSLENIEKYAVRQRNSTTPEAIGSVFSDVGIKPNEKLTRKIIFHIPSGKFDLIEASVTIISFGLMDGITSEWKYNKEDGLYLKLYRVAENGENIELEVDKNGAFISDAKLELQMSQSDSMLSLWQ